MPSIYHHAIISITSWGNCQMCVTIHVYIVSCISQQVYFIFFYKKRYIYNEFTFSWYAADIENFFSMNENLILAPFHSFYVSWPIQVNYRLFYGYLFENTVIYVMTNTVWSSSTPFDVGLCAHAFEIGNTMNLFCKTQCKHVLIYLQCKHFLEL